MTDRIVHIIKEFQLKRNTNLFLFYLQSKSSYLKGFQKVKKQQDSIEDLKVIIVVNCNKKNPISAVYLGS